VPGVSRPFQVFVKPAGAACNLDCSYCYYVRKAPGEGPAVPRMPPDLLERYVAQHIEACPDRDILFSWHGGEPTLLGLDYFREVVRIERRHQPPGRRVLNGIQTNGVLLDHDWCRFLADEGFRVGLSLDGPSDVHDACRTTRGRGPTWARVMRAHELLQRLDVPSEILCAVHGRNAREPARVYRFFRSIGARSLGLLPVVERRPGEPGGVSADSVTPEAWGAFLCTVFDEWRERDSDRIAVQLFDEASRPARGLPHSLCVFSETCGNVPVVEHDGTFYACDHFVDAAHRVGNLNETPLAELLESPAQIAFGQAKRDLLPGHCRACEVLAMCNGGCPKDRFARTPEGREGLNYLCTGFRRFFGHTRGYALRIAGERRGRPSLDQAMRQRAGGPARTARAAGRNDPCPCGSGRKYKKCCMASDTGSNVRP
jgi:uncharacterized protein